ncbi:unnamed protein product [Brachionus calyciflorus]|uniref:G-protein coupled receptors family 3 profile domain-containing protein n=1 Tax=Brachionus calyciflorus TaxID=104777 RepID=A0A813XE07_9BILA|nr:unnamed protein product [Brachionus calyciflorus]
MFVKTLPLKLLILIYINSSEAFYGKRNRIIASGDLMIGVLLPVHQKPSITNFSDSSIINKRICGEIRDQYGIQRVEALLYLLDKINKNNTLLPGIKLGLEIRDECWETSVALEETIDFIKHTIATREYDEDICEIYPKSNETICKKIIQDKCNENKILAVIGPAGSGIAINVQNLLQLFNIPQIGYSATSTGLSDKKMFKTFLRVVPSDYLQVNAMMDVVLKMNWTYVFAIYSDGIYGQGGMEAFRKKSDYLNICFAMYEKISEYATNETYEVLVRKMNAITSAKVIVCFCEGETIRGLLAAIKTLGLKGRFVILGSDGWSDRTDVARDHYEEALGSLSIKAYSPVVKEFDDYFEKLNPSNNFRNVWFNEYWERRFECYINEENKDKFGVPCKKKCPKDFVDLGNKCIWLSNTTSNFAEAQLMCKNKHFDSDLLEFYQNDTPLQLYLQNQTKNETRSPIFVRLTHNHNPNSNCKYKNSGNEKPFNKLNDSNQCFSIVIDIKNRKRSSSKESYCFQQNKCNDKLRVICELKYENINSEYADSLKNYEQDPKMSYVMNALLSIVYGLERIHKIVCQGKAGLCEKMKKLNGSELLESIRKISFFGITGEGIFFDENGDPPGRYVILNVQKNSTGYVYTEIGNWNSYNLTLDLSKIKFPNNKTNWTSVCSEECEFGYVKQIKHGDKSCCWTCKKCEDYSYIRDESTCQECKSGFWPNENLTGCIELPLIYSKWSEPALLFAIFVSALGILINTFIAYVFVKFSNTCVVKSTTKELSFIILFGVYLCYLMTIPLVLKPSNFNCYISRFLPGISLSIIYGALLTKTNRIARILSRSKKKIFTKKLRFISLSSQIVITSIIIGIELCLIISGLIYNPVVKFINYSKRNEARLQCSMEEFSIIGPLGYNMFLVAVCTLYAVQTRNLPENFNEAKFIGFSMYTTCVIWVAFFPLFFGSEYKVISLCLSVSFSATVILIFLFIPKVYIILFEPEKNQRSAFATSKDIRCHFGTNVKSSSGLENEFSSSQRKKSSGMLFLAGLAGSKIPRTESKPKNISSYARFAYRPKLSRAISNQADRYSFESFTSMYQISDRSCQTSLEFLPFIQDSVLKQVNRKNDSNDKKNEVIKKESIRENRRNGFIRRSLTSFRGKNSKKNKLDEKQSHLNDRLEELDESKSQNSSNIVDILDLNNNETVKFCFNDTESSREPNTDDYSIQMNNEEKSLEDLRRTFSKNSNLVLNWDYVQSSGYL